MDLQFRLATPSDASKAAVLIADTMRGYGIATMGLGSRVREISILENWFARPGNRFSYEFTWLALVDGQITGLLLSLRGDRLAKLERALAQGIFRLYNLPEIVRMLWRLMVLGRSDEAERDEYVLAHLAVAPQFQRRGIALALLEKAVEEARKNGFSRLVLEVEIGNTPAEKLYERFGFTHLFTTQFNRHAQLLQCPGYHKLLKVV